MSEKINENASNGAENAVVNTNAQPPVKKKHTSKLFKTAWAERVPETTRNLVYILRNNTEIRRFTAIGIINYLLQKGEIEGEKRFVDFLWNKFAVKVDGFTREYRYTEPFFLNCFVAAFSSFSASAQRVINDFCRAEMSVNLDKATNIDEINEITEANEKYIAGQNNE